MANLTGSLQIQKLIETNWMESGCPAVTVMREDFAGLELGRER